MVEVEAWKNIVKTANLIVFLLFKKLPQRNVPVFCFCSFDYSVAPFEDSQPLKCICSEPTEQPFVDNFNLSHIHPVSSD